MNYVIIITVCILVVLFLVHLITQLTEKLEDANVIIEEREIKINSNTIKIVQLRGKLAESNDKIESLQVANDQQALTIRDFQIVTGSKSYPNAPIETINKAIIRDAKGHFVKH